jgi:hypothetical protein
MADDALDKRIFESVWDVAQRRVFDRAIASTELLDDTLRALGPIRRREQDLCAGDRVLNDDRQILPRIARATSLGLSIYLGNRRVASSSVLDAGETAPVGGYADAVVVEAVLRRREVFRGVLDRAGRPTLLACRPLYARDTSDEYGPLGMIEAYQDMDTFRDMIVASLRSGMDADTRTGTVVHADRVEGILRFIDDIARRLQLLALNGNIIAAQAGDHGRAFRVVCRELSSLADQAKDTVSDVRELADAVRGSESADDALDGLDGLDDSSDRGEPSVQGDPGHAGDS